MAEYTAVTLQNVGVNDNVIFTDSPIPCRKGYVLHRDDSGIFKARGITNGGCFARYRVQFGGNVSTPTGGTVGAVSVAISVDGEAIGSATATVTPAAVGEAFNVNCFALIDVPKCCCSTISVQNISTIPINVANANITFDRVA